MPMLEITKRLASFIFCFITSLPRAFKCGYKSMQHIYFFSNNFHAFQYKKNTTMNNTTINIGKNIIGASNNGTERSIVIRINSLFQKSFSLCDIFNFIILPFNFIYSLTQIPSKILRKLCPA